MGRAERWEGWRDGKGGEMGMGGSQQEIASRRGSQKSKTPERAFF